MIDFLWPPHELSPFCWLFYVLGVPYHFVTTSFCSTSCPASCCLLWFYCICTMFCDSILFLFINKLNKWFFISESFSTFFNYWEDVLNTYSPHREKIKREWKGLNYVISSLVSLFQLLTKYLKYFSLVLDPLKLVDKRWWIIDRVAEGGNYS